MKDSAEKQPENRPSTDDPRPLKTQEQLKLIPLRLILSLFLIFLLFTGVIYKYFEWKTLQRLAETHRESQLKEIALEAESDKIADEFIMLFNDFIASESATFEEKNEALDKVKGKARLLNSVEDEYLRTLKSNDLNYQSMNKPVQFLLGKRGTFAGKLVDVMKQYYQQEIQGTEDGKISNDLFLNYLNIVQDGLIIAEHYPSSENPTEQEYYNFFRYIPTLEKYTREDFKFQTEDKIKELYPYGYGIIDTNRKLLKSIYIVSKDAAAGDFESAGYKASRITDQTLDLNIDYERFYTEGKERRTERAKKITELVFASIELIKEYEQSRLGEYPLVSAVGSWKEDVTACQLYFYKASLFEQITANYPEANSVDELIRELAEVPPRNKRVDEEFDRSVMSYSNTDDAMNFECRDEEHSAAFTFKIQKFNQE